MTVKQEKRDENLSRIETRIEDEGCPECQRLRERLRETEAIKRGKVPEFN